MSNATVILVPEGPPRRVPPSAAAKRRLRHAKRTEAWVLMFLMTASSLLAVFDLYLLSAGLG
jgi:hypothetical protein